MTNEEISVKIEHPDAARPMKVLRSAYDAGTYPGWSIVGEDPEPEHYETEDPEWSDETEDEESEEDPA